MRRFEKFAIGMAGVAIAVTLASGMEVAMAVQAETTPNIICVILDELGYYELSCMGHPEMKTPNMDRMASEGVRFTQFLAGSSACAPTRCALLTGKHTGHATVRSNGGFAPLLPGEETIGSVLKKAGYATGGFGKWGVGGRGTSGVPEKHGFDVFFGYYDQVHAHTYFPRYLIRNSEEVPLPGNTGNPAEGETFSHYRIYEEAMNFIRENAERPFFCYLPWTPPHGHWGFPKDDPAWEQYKDKEDWPKNAREYAAMVNMIDRQLGEMRDLLQELGIAENTLIVFTGDNGGSEYFRSEERPAGFFGPNVNPHTGVRFRGGKRNFYEGGLRVPAIAYWPGRIEGGRVSDHLGYFPDLLPTFAEVAGAQPPEGLDGISFLPTLLGKGEQPQHEYLYWEDNAFKAVRMENWKAIRLYRRDKPWELYDLSQDIGETDDVAEQFPTILAKLIGLAEQAHTPVVEGEIYDRELIEKDRKYFEKKGKGK
jgi:arylsulfatase A-like enzyme